MELPLPTPKLSRTKIAPLAQALLSSGRTTETHVALLRTAFTPELPPQTLRGLARRTFAWTSRCPQPRLKELIGLLRAEPFLHQVAKKHTLLALPFASAIPQMHPLPGVESQVRLDTVRELADWLELDPEHVHWFADLRDWNRSGTALLRNYNCPVLAKPYGPSGWSSAEAAA